MATRGRKPSPIELKLVRGNPGKRPLNITARVLRQDEALACDRPTMLLEEAASYWDADWVGEHGSSSRVEPKFDSAFRNRTGVRKSRQPASPATEAHLVSHKYPMPRS